MKKVVLKNGKRLSSIPPVCIGMVLTITSIKSAPKVQEVRS